MTREPEFVAVHWENPEGHQVREVDKSSSLLAFLRFACSDARRGSEIAVEVGLGYAGEEHPIRVERDKLARMFLGLSE